ncbi:hypothetical protein PHYSODRAFT_257746 [Phytophthora sojae]|uniref:Uncharacterized protein n=1 Tax=Phytophthora sojae (strain P6497) TaxID=1094619 RepID=G4YWC6_PHYSP|nr:hypothetical protein PHYSODRAFT_257746 [Phytophthora sojae]EGZ25573.1 hypothetical protein PHYSODRAFT_257746 [Phytophthora sojae]|eukprot:XP_009520861.1 hypothetical protein PHYSODRAFT_257746 [Phytophthora sojae]
MAPKISSVLGFHEREQLHKNPSILAYTGDVGQNYLDLGDGYEDQEREQAPLAQPRDRDRSNSEKKATTSSRLTSLSSSLHSARAAVTTRARKLHVRASTRQAISHLRKTMTKRSSSRTEANKESVATDHHQSNQFDNDRFSNDRMTDAGNQVGVENAGYKCMYAEVNLGNDMEFRHSARGSTAASTGSRLSKLLPPRPWIKNSKQKRRFSDELH